MRKWIWRAKSTCYTAQNKANQVTTEAVCFLVLHQTCHIGPAKFWTTLIPLMLGTICCHLVVFYIFALLNHFIFCLQETRILGNWMGKGNSKVWWKVLLLLSFPTSIFGGRGLEEERGVTITIYHFPSCLFFFQDKTAPIQLSVLLSCMVGSSGVCIWVWRELVGYFAIELVNAVNLQIVDW